MDRRTFLAGAGVLAACKTKAFDGYAFVANEEGQALAVVDLAAFALTRHIPLNDRPTAFIAHPRKNLLYALTPKSGVIHEIDSEKMAITRQVQAASSLMGMRYDEQRNVIWAMNRPNRKLVRVNVDSFHVDGSIPLLLECDEFDISSDAKLAAVSSFTSGSVALIDLEEKRAAKPQRIADEVGAVRFRSDGKALLVANTADRRLSILDAPSGATIAQLPLAVRPDNLCFDRGGGQLFITGQGQDSVVVVYVYYVAQVAETVLAGSAPAAMAASNTHLFVANPHSGYVTILNIERRRVVASVAVGSEPGHIAITPQGEYALVLNRASGDMAVIRTASIVPDRRKAAALFTMIPVGSKPVSAVVKVV